MKQQTVENLMGFVMFLAMVGISVYAISVGTTTALWIAAIFAVVYVALTGAGIWKIVQDKKALSVSPREE